MGLAADRLLRLLVEQDDLAARVDELGGGHEPREPGSDHDHVSVVRHAATRPPSMVGQILGYGAVTSQQRWLDDLCECR
ncbi:hypothetical protein GCM10010343_69310 [Streptomyces avidinii]|nr:hypothetical protein GCM10010343_69310 [Streptomyces avidinii]